VLALWSLNLLPSHIGTSSLQSCPSAHTSSDLSLLVIEQLLYLPSVLWIYVEDQSTQESLPAKFGKAPSLASDTASTAADHKGISTQQGLM
jgi:hypothetical protein